MWKNPRLVARWLIVSLLLTLVRLPFMGVQPIPHYLELNPGIVLVPVFAVLWGPAGVWGSLAAALLGDALTGMWGGMTFFRATGWWAMALTAKRLWAAYPMPAGPDGKHRDGWRPAFRCLLVSVPGCFAAAGWYGLGTEWLRLFPMAYTSSLTILHHFGFTVILMLPLYRMMIRLLHPDFSDWQDEDQPAPPPVSRMGILLIITGSIGGAVASSWMSISQYGLYPFTPYMLGSFSGPMVTAIGTLFLTLHLVGLFLRKKAASGDLPDIHS